MNTPIPDFSYLRGRAMNAANDPSESRAKTMHEQSKQVTTLDRTAKIVAAHVGNNTVGADAVPRLIRDIHETLLQVEKGDTGFPTEQQPAVPIKKSITPDYLICLEDGKKFRTLTRHLKKFYGMTPKDYREKWDLPANYPMVAPNYAKERSRIAKEIGLGKRGDRLENQR
jgi:predicted transcriptional regulator